MKLCTYEYSGLERVGIILDDNRLADINTAYAAHLNQRGETRAKELADVLLPPSMLGIIEGGESSFKASMEAEQASRSAPQMTETGGGRIFYSLEEVNLRAPVPRTGKILAIALNRKQIFDNAVLPEGEPHPFYFIKPQTCITGPYDPIEIPDIGVTGSEVEVATIIGKKGKNIPVERANEYIFGYTVHNDITAHELRDSQEWIIITRPGQEPSKLTYSGRYKCYDTFSPMGPWLVTSDEVGEIDHRKMEARINGEPCQQGSTSDMTFKFPYLISYLSEVHTLEPGDIVSGGTVVATERWGSTSNIDLRGVGGVLETEVEGFGILRNPIKPV